MPPMRLYNVYHGGDTFVGQVLAWSTDHAIEKLLGAVPAEVSIMYVARSIN
jgi:hypothetical protein